MALGRVLVIGLDPAKIEGWDPEPVEAAIARGHAHFGDQGIEADLCLVAVEENAEAAIVSALTGRDYACVVIGGGIRKHEPLLEFFETVVNLVRQHAPGAAIAFNRTPEDTADAALRWLRQPRRVRQSRRDGASDVGADGRVPDDLVAAYRADGFVRVRGVLDPDQVERFRSSAEAFLTAHRAESLEKQGAFTQLVNVWQRDDNLRALTFDSRLGRIAEQLAGFPLRLWHDQMLVKEPHNNVATEFHQDRPYWPHAGDRLPLSAWIALVDVPPERGCMTFLPGTQHRTGLRPQDLHHSEDLFALDPSLRWLPRVTVPLRAGDCTFHSGFTGHMALPNRTDLARLAHVVIYIDEATTYSGAPHVVTDPLGLAAGDRLDGDTFPRPWS